MAKRIPLGGIGVTREVGGKKTTMYPKIGEVFDFTAEEMEQIIALEKASGNQLIRKPKNEDPAQASGEDTATDLSKMTVAQLKEEAVRREVDLGAATTKAEILAKLEAEDL